ncbi:tungstate transport system substrate-binding protein [Ardenticatena maritima]|uniref:Tungstate transport system substrate-binding protein n=1 Tax=Ardenticatena maritima TaxID=872965 RepID=A0A0M8KAG3_9CHLR|nr:substrate-binding domain-containing protein [Ardenticatena maritima]GAP63606.1 tungstate transport system substrate-binding protein [Ardenticatena maritima]
MKKFEKVRGWAKNLPGGRTPGGFLFVLLGVLVLTACTGRTAAQRDVLLATTTSTRDSGLLDVLIPRFEAQSGYRVKMIAVGTGAALQMGRDGNADVLLVHAPEAEEAFMREGHGMARFPVMHNDFVLVGPPDDPASIRGRSIIAALQHIAAQGARFISRGDDSGTHKKERALWAEAGISPEGATWYNETGQGMGATLTIASEKQAYTLADRGTFLAIRNTLALDILVEGDRRLFNPYHVIIVSPTAHPNVNVEGARAFAAFLTTPDTQALIRTFGVETYGEPLFIPDAVQP